MKTLKIALGCALLLGIAMYFIPRGGPSLPPGLTFAQSNQNNFGGNGGGLASPGPIGGTTPSTGAFTALSCGVLNTTTCVITGFGGTSGTATITYPSSNNVLVPFLFSNVLRANGGGAGNPTYSFTNATSDGMWDSSGGGGPVNMSINSSNVSSWNLSPATADTVVGGIDTAWIKYGGTTFGASGCTISALVGGASGGKFVSGTTGACTVVITPGFTAPNGWSCFAANHTTPANLIQESGALSATTATLLGTTNSGDIITFGCQPF